MKKKKTGFRDLIIIVLFGSLLIAACFFIVMLVTQDKQKEELNPEELDSVWKVNFRKMYDAMKDGDGYNDIRKRLNAQCWVITVADGDVLSFDADMLHVAGDAIYSNNESDTKFIIYLRDVIGFEELASEYSLDYIGVSDESRIFSWKNKLRVTVTQYFNATEIIVTLE